MLTSCRGGGHGSARLREAISLSLSWLDLRDRRRTERDGGIRRRVRVRAFRERAGARSRGHLGKFCVCEPRSRRWFVARLSWHHPAHCRAFAIDKKTAVL